MDKKFAVPFAGAADELTDSGERAAKAQPFPDAQVDESRNGAMRGDAKFSKSVGCDPMQSTVTAPAGYSGWKKMETW